MKNLIVSIGVAVIGVAAVPACLAADCVGVAVSPDGRNAIRLGTDPLSYEVLRDGPVNIDQDALGDCPHSDLQEGVCLPRR